MTLSEEPSESSSSQKQSEIEARFLKLREKIFDRRTVLKEILEKQGKQSIYDYISSYTAVKYQPPLRDRQKELIAVFQKEVEKRLDVFVAESAARQLEDYFYVSTTDHHSPLHHPWVLNFDLISSFIALNHPDPALKNVITLACSHVSLNNPYFPRGLTFTASKDGHAKVQRIGILPSNAHSYPVYAFRPYLPREIQKVKTNLYERMRSGEITKEAAERLVQIMEEIFENPNLLSAQNYPDQVTKVNFLLWKKMFQNDQRKEINFVYIEQEALVNELLIQHHLRKDTLLHDFIFNPRLEKIFLKYFDEVPEAFSSRNHTGTYFFWALSGSGKHRVRLWRNGNALVSEDGAYRFELTPDNIEQALRSRQLVPSIWMTFMVLAFYYGLRCFGGLGQINYLTQLKQAYIRMEKDEGNPDAVSACENVETKNLGGEITVGFLQTNSKELIPATSLDLLLYGNQNTFVCIENQAKKITLEEAICPMFAEDYPIVYKSDEREPEILSLTPKQITQVLGLDKKIEACAKIPD